MKLKDLNIVVPVTELCQLGRKHGTDKSQHGYTKLYYCIMKEYRMYSVNLFEIGICVGASLKMWEEFFPNGKIFGIDNGRKIQGSEIQYSRRNETPTKDDLRLLQEGQLSRFKDFSRIETDRIKCFGADQRSRLQLRSAFNYFQCKKFNFIIDDGQHYQEHQQKSLGVLFKNVKSKGYYVIEDVCPQSLLLGGCYWGQKKNDCSDSTDVVFRRYIKTGKLSSDYIGTEDIEYIEEYTEDIFIYNALHKNNSPVGGSSNLIILKKK